MHVQRGPLRKARQAGQRVFREGLLEKSFGPFAGQILGEEGGLSVARKKESYEICFVPEKDGYAKIVEREADVTPGEGAGEIVDVDGNVVGTHEGYYHFTIGQRRGLQLGGSSERTYVLDVNPFTKRVVIGPASPQ